MKKTERQQRRQLRLGRREFFSSVCLALLCVPTTLHAQGSSGVAPACRSEEHRQFDFWVGEWEVDNRHRQPGENDPTWYNTGTARDRVSAVLDGCAIIEQWQGLLSFDEVVGFSVRAYNPVNSHWDLVILWPSTDRAGFGMLTGNFRHHRGEFYSESTDMEGETTISRFTFSDVGPDWLRWDVATSPDSGLHWRPAWIMEFTRIGRAPTPVPADSVHRCEFPQIFELDFALGWWAGTAVLADGREAPISMHTEPIVQGCGTLEQIDIGEGEWKSLQVMTFESGPRAWASYRMDTAKPVLHRMEGSARGAIAEFEGVRIYVDGETLIRRRWEYQTDGSIRTVLSETVNGMDWTDVYAARLTKVSDVQRR